MNDRFLEQCERLLPGGSVDVTVDPLLISPPSVEGAADVVRLAAEHKVACEITGGGTYPQPVPRSGMIRLSTRGIQGETVIDTDDFVAEVAAGTTVDEAVEAAAVEGMEFPLDIFSGATATVGGAFMTRASGGARRLGSTFPDSVLGGRFVVASGEIVTAGGRMIKNVTGYDLTRFFAGSMGMFGIAARLYVKLTALREVSTTIAVRFPAGGDAIYALNELKTETTPDVVQLSAPEGLAGGTLLLVRFSGFAGIVETAVGRAGDIASRCHATVEPMPDDQSRALIRNSVTTVFASGTVTAATHPSAVRTALRNICECCPDMPVAMQVNDGRFWFLPGGGDKRDGFTKAITSTGGKRPVVWADIRSQGIAGLFSDDELTILRSLKKELDPAGLFNPQLAL